MKILAGKLPERIVRQLARRPMLFISGLSLSVKVGKDAVQLKRGKIDGTEFRLRTGASVGGVSLGAAGSYAGLVAGHFIMPVPILGGLLGGFAGGALGEILGDRLGRKAVQSAEAALRKPPTATPAAEAGPEAPAEAEATAAPKPPSPGAEPPGTPRRNL